MRTREPAAAPGSPASLQKPPMRWRCGPGTARAKANGRPPPRGPPRRTPSPPRLRLPLIPTPPWTAATSCPGPPSPAPPATSFRNASQPAFGPESTTARPPKRTSPAGPSPSSPGTATGCAPATAATPMTAGAGRPSLRWRSPARSGPSRTPHPTAATRSIGRRHWWPPTATACRKARTAAPLGPLSAHSPQPARRFPARRTAPTATGCGPASTWVGRSAWPARRWCRRSPPRP